MKNFKKVCALVLSLAMVFSTFAMPTFAAEEAAADEKAVEEKVVEDKVIDTTDAKTCEKLKVLKGSGDDGVSDEYLAESTTRLQAALILLRLKGLETIALNFEGTENFADAEDLDWEPGKNALAYLKAHPELGWVGNGKTFRPNDVASAQMLYKAMLESLGYKQGEDFEWAEVIEKAEELGLKKIADVEELTNNHMAIAIVEALQTETKDGEKLISVLVEAGAITDVETAKELGYVEPVVLALKSINSIDDQRIEVVFDNEGTAEVGDFTVVDKDNKDVELKEVKVASEKSMFVDFEKALKVGEKYELTFNGVTKEFVGAVNDKTEPAISSSVSIGNTRVKVMFKAKDSLKSDILNPDNYTVNNDLVVVGAEYELDSKNMPKLDSVILTTNSQVKGKIYTIKASNISDKAGNVIDSSKTKTFAGQKADKTKPSIYSAVAMNGSELKVQFTESSLMDVSTLGELNNYSVADLDLVGIEVKSNKVGQKKEVVITTAKQVQGKIYTLKVSNVADEFGNIIKSDSSKTFSGTKTRTTKLSVSSAVAITDTKVKLTFSYDVDKALACDVSNYSIDKDLVVEDVEMWKNPADENDIKSVVITTSQQVKGRIYKVTVENVTDRFGNALGNSNSRTFSGRKADKTAPTYTVSSKGKNTVEVLFEEKVEKESAETLSNYVFEVLGYPSAASLASDCKTLTLTTADQKVGKVYKLAVTNVKDLAGNAMKETEKTFAGSSSIATKVTITSIASLDNQTLKISFSEDVNKPDLANLRAWTISKDASAINNDIASNGTSEVALGTNVNGDSIQYDGSNKSALLIRFKNNKKLDGGRIYKLNIDTSTSTPITALVDDSKIIKTDGDANKVDFGSVDDDVEEIKVIDVSPVEGSSGLAYTVKFNTKLTRPLPSITASDMKFNYKNDSGDKIESVTTYKAASADTIIVTIANKISPQFTVFNFTLEGTVANIKDIFNDKSVKLTNSDYKNIYASGENNAGKLKIESAVGVNANEVEVTFNEPISVTSGQINTVLNSNLGDFAIVEEGTTKVSTASAAYVDATDKTKVHFYFDDNAAGLEEGIAYYVVLDSNSGKLGTKLKGQYSDTSLSASTGDDGHKASFGYVSETNEKPSIAGVNTLSKNKIRITMSEDLDVLVNGSSPKSDMGLVIKNVPADSYNVTKIDNKSVDVELLGLNVFLNDVKYRVYLDTSLKGLDKLNDAASKTGESNTMVEFSGIASESAVPNASELKFIWSDEASADWTNEKFESSVDIERYGLKTIEVVVAATTPTASTTAEFEFDVTGSAITANTANTLNKIGTPTIDAGDTVYYRFIDEVGNTSEWVADGTIAAAPVVVVDTNKYKITNGTKYKVNTGSATAYNAVNVEYSAPLANDAGANNDILSIINVQDDNVTYVNYTWKEVSSPTLTLPSKN